MAIQTGPAIAAMIAASIRASDWFTGRGRALDPQKIMQHSTSLRPEDATRHLSTARGTDRGVDPSGF